MESLITELGVGGIFAILLIREATALVQKMKGESSTSSQTFICGQCKELLGKLTEAIKEQIEALRDIHQALDLHESRTAERLHYFEKQVDRIAAALANGKTHSNYRGDQ